jgi:hypothetical protein
MNDLLCWFTPGRAEILIEDARWVAVGRASILRKRLGPKPSPAGIAAHSVSHQIAAMFNDSFSKKLELQVASRLALVPTKF